MKAPRAVIFDLDNTLAEAFQPLQPHVTRGLHDLLEHVPIAVMTGASIERLEEHFFPSLPDHIDKTRVYLFPDTCAQCFVWKDNDWRSVYTFSFTEEEYRTILAALTAGLEETGILKGASQWGERVLARNVQITLAALGIDASPEAKAAWDPTREKRAKLKAFLDPLLPGFDVRISGRTAIDITRTGINKAYGVEWLAKHLGLAPSDMLFVGDDLSEGGNDAMVIPTGIATREVAGPHEVADAIDDILASCRN